MNITVEVERPLFKARVTVAGTTYEREAPTELEALRLVLDRVRAVAEVWRTEGLQIEEGAKELAQHIAQLERAEPKP